MASSGGSAWQSDGLHAIVAHLFRRRLGLAGCGRHASTDRKFKPQSTSTDYTLNPPSSTTTLCSPQPTFNFSSKTDFVRCSQRFDARHRRKLYTAYNPDLPHHTTQRTKPAPDPHLSTPGCMCDVCSARLPAKSPAKLRLGALRSAPHLSGILRTAYQTLVA